MVRSYVSIEIIYDYICIYTITYTFLLKLYSHYQEFPIFFCFRRTQPLIDFFLEQLRAGSFFSFRWRTASIFFSHFLRNSSNLFLLSKVTYATKSRHISDEPALENVCSCCRLSMFQSVIIYI